LRSFLLQFLQIAKSCAIVDLIAGFAVILGSTFEFDPMTTQPDNTKAINDSELEAASGGVTFDGQEMGKNVTISGSDNLKIDKIEVGDGDTFTFS
jgi:hypothetical protein